MWLNRFFGRRNKEVRSTSPSSHQKLMRRGLRARQLQHEQLEDRRLLSITASVNAGGNLVTFAGDVIADSLTIDVNTPSGTALLRHDLRSAGGDVSYADDFDFDNTTLGSQHVTASAVTSISFTDTGNNDNVTLGRGGASTLTGLNGAATLSIANAATIADNGNVTIGGNASFVVAGAGSITLGGGAETTHFGSLTFGSTGTVQIQQDSPTALQGLSSGGNVTLSSTGAITDSDADALVDIQATTLSVTANTFGAAGVNNEIGTTVGTLSVNTSGFGGDQYISESNALIVANLSAGAGNIILDAGGTVTSQTVDGFADIVGATVDVDVTGGGNTIGTGGGSLEINATTLNATTNGGAGDDIFALDTAGGLAAGTINAGAGNVTLDVLGGSLTSATVDGTADIIGATVDVDVTGGGNTIGTGGGSLEINATTLNATTNGGAGDDIFALDTAGGLAAGTINAGAGNVTLDVLGGSLTSATVDGTADIIGATVDVDVTGGGNTIGTGGGSLEINATTLNATTNGGAGDDIFALDTAGGLAAGTINAGAGNVTLDVLGGSLTSATVDGTADIIGATVDVDVTGGGNTIGTGGGSLEINATTLNATTNGGAGDDIFALDTAGGLAAGTINAGAGNVTLDVLGGSLTSATVDGTADIVGATVDVDVTGGGNTIGTGGGSLEINATTLNATTNGGAGDDIFALDTAGGLAAGTINAGAGNVTLDVLGGSLTSATVDGTADIVGATVDVDVTGGGNTIGTGGGSLEINATTLNATTNGGAGDDIFALDTAGGLAAGTINAGAGNVTLDVLGGSLTSATVDGTADIIGATVDVDVTGGGNTIGTGGGSLEINATTLNATTNGGAGDDIFALDTAGGLAAGTINAGAGNVTLDVLGGSLTSATVDGTADIIGATVDVDVTGGGNTIGTGGGSLEINATTLNATTNGGAGDDIFALDTAGGLAAGTINAGAGNVTLDVLGGSLTSATVDGTADIVGATVDVDVTGGGNTIGTGGGSLEINATTLNATTNGGAGDDIFALDTAGGLAAGTINAGAGNVTLDVLGGSLTSATVDGTADIIGATVDVDVTGGGNTIGTGGGSLEINATTLNATTNGGAGDDIFALDTAGGLAAGTINAGAGNVTLDVLGGSLTSATVDGTADIVGATVDVDVTGGGNTIGTGGGSLEINATTLNATTNGGAGDDIFALDTAGGLAAGTINAGAGNVTLDVLGGSLTSATVDGTADIVGATVDVDVTGGGNTIGTGGGSLEINATTLNATTNGGAGDDIFALDTAGGLAAGTINAGAGNVTLDVLGGSLTSATVDGTADIIGATVDVDVTGGGNTIGTGGGSLEINATTLNATTNGGAGDDIFALDTAGGLAAGTINAGAGNVTLDVLGGSLTSATVDGTADIVGATVDVDVTGGGNTIGTGGGSLEINATTLNATTNGGAGDDIFALDTAGGLAAGTINAGAGNVTLDVLGGSLTSATVDGTADIIGATVDVDVTGGGNTIGTGGGSLEINATTLNATTNGGAGDDIFALDTAGGLAAGTINAGAGNVTLDVLGGSLTSATVDGTADIIGATVDVDVTGGGNTIGTGGGSLEINATTLNATTNGGAGDDIFALDTAGGLAAGTINAGAGNVTLDVLGGSLTSATVDGTADIIGATVDVDVTGGGNTIGVSEVSPLEIDASTLNATTNGALGDNIFILEATGLVEFDVNAGSGDVRLETAAGALASADAGTTDVMATNAALIAVDGIGSIVAIDTSVSTLAASNATSGNIQIDNGGTGLLTIGTVGSVVGVTNTAPNPASVTITNASPLTVADDVTAFGNITLTATDSGAVGDDLTVNGVDTAGTGTVIIDSTSGNVALNAGDDVLLIATLPPSTRVRAQAGAITIDVDNANSQPGADPDGGVGSTVTLQDANVLDSANGARITGGNDDDVFNIIPQVNSTVHVDGDDPTVPTGDTLNLDLTGLTDAVIDLIPTTSGFVGQLTASGVNTVTWMNIETFDDISGAMFDLRVRMDLSTDAFLTAAPFNLPSGFEMGSDGTADQVRVEMSGLNLLQVTVDDGVNTPTFPIPLDDIKSLEVVGSGDADNLLIPETGFGLPAFGGDFGAGGVGTTSGFSNTGHVNQSMVDQGLVPANIGIHFDGGGGVNALDLDLQLNDHYVSYFSDDDVAGNSGNINVQDTNPVAAARLGFSLSFANLAPIDVLGAGPGSLLLVDATSTPGTSTIDLEDDSTAAGPFGGLFGAAAANDGVSAISGNGGLETTRFANFGTVMLRGGTGAEAITVATVDMGVYLPIPAANPLATLVIDGDDTTETDMAADTLHIQNLPDPNPNGLVAYMFGGQGDGAGTGDTFNLFSGPILGLGANTVDGIVGQVAVSPTPPTLPAGFGFSEETDTDPDTLNIDDRGDTAGDNVLIGDDNSATPPFVTPFEVITNITGFASTNAASPDIEYGVGDQIETINLWTSDNGADEVDVEATRAGSVYNIYTMDGHDTVNIFSDAFSAAPGTGGNLLNDIDGQVNVNTGANTGVGAGDTLNVSDFGDTNPDTYTFSFDKASGGARTVINFDDGATPPTAPPPQTVGDIRFNVDETDTLENFQIWGGEGNDVFTNDDGATPAGSRLQASMFATLSNIINGHEGDDTFTFEWEDGFSLPATTGFTINGDGSTNRDIVNLRADADTGAARDMTLRYVGAGSVDVGGLGGTAGTLDASVVAVTTVEQLNFIGDAGDDDLATVYGDTTDDVLSVTPLTDNSANVFLGGLPMLTIPPSTPATNDPGIAGGSAGPDIYVDGLDRDNGLTLDGGTGADQLVVNASTEDVDGASGGAAWSHDAPIDQLGGTVGETAVYGTNEAFNNITVTDDLVTIDRIDEVTPLQETLISVHIMTGTFAGSLATDAELTVNTGEEDGVRTSGIAAGIADDVTVELSTLFRFQINGGEPPMPLPVLPTDPTPDLEGDRLNVEAIPNGNINIHADTADPPNVSIFSAAGGSVSQPAVWNNIEIVNVRPDDATETVNIIGDNNGNIPNQQDEIIVLGQDVDSTLGATGIAHPSDGDGANEFSLLINGSNPIGVYNTRFLNITGAGGDDDITIDPHANDTTGGWDIDVRVDGGDGTDDVFYGNIERDVTDQPGIVFVDDWPDGSQAGVSEDVVLAPTTTVGEGQIRATNAADGSDIVTIDFTTLEDVSFFFNDGSQGDTDSLTILGTNQADIVTADFTNDGLVFDGGVITPSADQLIDVAGLVHVHGIATAIPVVPTDPTDPGAPPTLGALASIAFELGDGDDVFNVTGQPTSPTPNSASAVTPFVLNVDGGNPDASDTIELTGTADANDEYDVWGATSHDGKIEVLLDTASTPTTINFTNTEFIDIDGGGSAGSDTVSLYGNGDDNVFTLTGTGVLAGDAQVDAGPVVSFAALGSDSSDLLLDGQGGDDSFAVNHYADWGFDEVTLDGGAPSASDSVSIVGVDDVADTIAYTASSPNDAVLNITNGTMVSYVLTDIESVSVDAQEGAGNPTDVLNAQNDPVSIIPGAAEAGTVQPFDGDHHALLPLSYVNVEDAVAAANVVAIQGTEGDDEITVYADGTVEVEDELGNETFFDASAATGLVINALGGDDTIIIEGSALFSGTGIRVIGGDNGDGSDVLNYTSAAEAWLDLAKSAIEVPMGTDVLTYDGIEHLNFTHGGNALTVQGSTVDDTFTVTPQDADEVDILANGAYPLVHTMGAGTLTVDPLDGADTIELIGSGADDTIDVADTTLQITTPGSKTVTYSNAEALSILAGLGSDTINVAADVTTPLFIDGGEPSNSDTLTLADADDARVTQAETSTSGLVDQLPGDTADVSYVNVEELEITGTGTLTVRGTTDNDAITIGDGGAPEVTINDGTVITFAGYETVDVHGRAGDDNFSITPLGTAITAQGMDPTGSDHVVINASGAMTVSSLTGDGATIDNVTLQTIESLLIAGADLTVEAPAGATVVHTPGSSDDAGQVQVDSLLAVDYANATGLTVDGTAGDVQLIADGTAASDTFAVTAGAAIELNSRIDIDTNSVEAITLRGLGGDDTFNIAAVSNVTIDVKGDEPGSGSDVLNYTSAGPAALDLGRSTIEESLGTDVVTYAGIEQLNFHHGGSALTVQGSDLDDDFVVTPLASDDVTLQRNGVSPVVNADGAGAFTIDALDGNDSVTIRGGVGDDIFQNAGLNPVTSSLVTIAGLLPINLDNPEAITLEGQAGDDTFYIEPGDVPFFVDGGDPIGVFGDTLNIQVPPGATTTFAVGPENDEGGFSFDSAQPVSYDKIEAFGSINMYGNDLTVTGTGADDDIKVVGDGTDDLSVTINDGPTISYIDVGDLRIDAGYGDDDIDIDVDALTSVQITVDGNNPSVSGDTLTVSGGDANFTPDVVDGGDLQITGLTPAIDLDDIERVIYDGLGAGATLTVTAFANNQTFLHTPGLSPDGGRVQIDNLLAIEYASIGLGGSVHLDGDGNTDVNAVVNGTAASDTFRVAGTATIELNARVDIATSDVEAYTLRGLGGDDEFSITGQDGIRIRVEGDDSANLSNVLNYTASAAGDVVVELGASEIEDDGFGASPDAAFSGIDILNVTMGSGSATVQGTAGDDAMRVKPTSGTAATVEMTGQPLVNVSSVNGLTATFTVNSWGGDDEITIEGSADGNNITVDLGASPNVTVDALLGVDLTVSAGDSVAISALAGDDTITVTPGIVPFFVDGGNPIGVVGDTLAIW